MIIGLRLAFHLLLQAIAWVKYAYLVADVLEFLVIATFSVAWHRSILLSRPTLTFGRREIKFALWAAILSFGLFLPVGFALHWEIPPWIALPSMVGLAYIGARLVLILPSIAVDAPLSPRSSWVESREHGWALLLVVLLAALAGLLLTAPLTAVAVLLRDRAQNEAWWSILALISYDVLRSVAYLVATSIEVGALSFSYRAIVKRAAQQGAAADAPPPRGMSGPGAGGRPDGW